MPPVGLKPTISAGERPAAAHLLRSWVSFLRVNNFLSSLLIPCRLLQVVKLVVTYLFNFLVTCTILGSNFHSRILSVAH